MSNRELSEHLPDILQRMADGDKQAFQILYLETREDIYRTVSLLAHANDVNDIVNEVYIQIWKSAHRYDNSRPLRSWIHGITVRQVSSCRRKLWKGFRLFEKQKAFHPAEKVQEDDPVLREERQTELIHHLFKLSFKLRAVVILRYYHDYSLEEIAALLQIPLGTVKSRHHLAMAKMRKSMSEIYPDGVSKPYVY